MDGNYSCRERLVRIAISITMLALLFTGGAGAATIALSNSGGGTWQYSRDITITNPGAALTDYQVLVNLTGAGFPTGANTSGADIRFTNASGGELNYWIESWDYANRSAIMWLNVTSIPSGATTIRTYYGNPNATSSSNWNGTILPYVDSQATASAGWSARQEHASVVYNNAMWVLGGSRGLISGVWDLKNDVWNSTDGIIWTQVTSNSAWNARRQHIAINFNNKIWIIGGYSSDSDLNDVWSSTDGISWAQATASSFTPARRGTAGVVFNNQMWISGGVSGISSHTLYNDVWKSSDGLTWTQATANAGWSPRYGHTMLAFDNKLWIIGGTNEITAYTDVWYSTDGTTWTRATANAGFGGVSEHSSVVFDDKMWVFGGYSSSYLGNSVWYSSDGITWTQATASAGWSARNEQTSIVFNNRAWILGGVDDSNSIMNNEVWRMLRKFASPEPFISYNVTGRVLNASSTLGIPGASVKLDAYPQYNATTNITGDYSMSVPAGTYNITASLEPTFYTNSTTVSIESIDVVAQDIELVMKPTGAITGSVRNV